MAHFLVDDIFEVKDIDVGGKKFEKVSRIVARSENELDLLLDVNFEIFPLKLQQKIRFLLTKTLNEDGSADSGYYNAKATKTLADKFDYVMYGKVYKFELEKSGGGLFVYASFGGLLMELKGDPNTLKSIEVDSKVYLLIKKV